MKLIVYILYSLLLCSCASMIKPCKNFDACIPPPEPDYSNEKYWAALPWRQDYADKVPKKSELKENQENAKVDVFFIHPTTYYGKKGWNADVNKKGLNKFTERTVILHQATVFNESCKIFAPRYRQATLYSFTEDTKNTKEALDLAYSDVKTAFQYYLDHYNKGRPFIIASHSQGTRHAFQLVKDFFGTNDTLRELLVAAYLIGFKIKAAELSAIPPCDSADQTGCYVSWNTVKWNTDTSFYFESDICINPLTWKRDSIYAGREKNRGSTSLIFKKLDPGVTDAQCLNGELHIHRPSKCSYPPFGKLEYHAVDYGLFYMNIRMNVKQRIEQYFLSEK